MGHPQAITLTQLVSDYLAPDLRGHEEAFRKHVRSLNPQLGATPAIKPSAWTQNNHHGIVGTAFDYLMGTAWAEQSLGHVLGRAESACFRRAPQTGWTFQFLPEILAIGPVRGRPEGVRRRYRNYYRALVLLAELDALYRSRRARPPQWVTEFDDPDSSSFRQQLRIQYPVALVSELHQLLERGRHDLAPFRGCDTSYDPHFGVALPDVKIRADGDLLLDDLLLELKVSIHPEPKLISLLQVLSYAALDRLCRRTRITRIGIYNPRYGMLWIDSLDNAAAIIAFDSFAAFREWFRLNLMKWFKGRS